MLSLMLLSEAVPPLSLNVINLGRLGRNGHFIVLKLISGEHIGALAMSEPNCEFLISTSIPHHFLFFKVMFDLHGIICG